jgi:hypothetical protein
LALRLLAAALLIGVCGCGNTATVTGKVTYQGRPVTHGSVIFLNADGTARSGVIEPDGCYSVTGVTPGEVRIAVLSRDPSSGREQARSARSGDRPKRGTAPAKTASTTWFPLPRQLEDPAQSGLRCTVGAGHIGHDIDLR